VETTCVNPNATRVRATLAYDGTAFAGFQRQRSGRTVQDTLEAALGQITGAPLTCVAAGRTDRGVHASGQVVHFDYTGPVPVERLAQALVPLLPVDLAVRACASVPADFHARYWATSRTYEYTLFEEPLPSPLRERYAWRVPHSLSRPVMEACASLFLGEHDFRCFGDVPGSGEQRQRSVARHGWRRVVMRSTLTARQGDVVFTIEANAFLTHMARALAGTLVRVGAGALPIGRVAAALNGHAPAGPVAPLAPARGLCLTHVTYPQNGIAVTTSPNEPDDLIETE
jgi:tRNA pseudouridine38-40 synthase